MDGKRSTATGGQLPGKFVSGSVNHVKRSIAEHGRDAYECEFYRLCENRYGKAIIGICSFAISARGISVNP
jgi:hypothetical protein